MASGVVVVVVVAVNFGVGPGGACVTKHLFVTQGQGMGMLRRQHRQCIVVVWLCHDYAWREGHKR